MKTDSIKIQNLFFLPRRHIVPLFQRPYVWTQSQQWEPLWQDIRAVSERVLSGREVPPHFLGAVVLDQLRTGSREIEARLIIDGQQRLTTLQLVLAAFRDLCCRVRRHRYAHRLQWLTGESGGVSLRGSRSPGSQGLADKRRPAEFVAVMQVGRLGFAIRRKSSRRRRKTPRASLGLRRLIISSSRRSLGLAR